MILLTDKTPNKQSEAKHDMLSGGPCDNRVIIYVVDLKRQNHLQVGTNKPKLKVKMQSVSDDAVRKRLHEKPRFELAAKGVFRLRRCYILWQDIPDLRASNWESTATDG